MPAKLPAPPAFELYDYANDPLEMKNVAADYPNIVEQMRRGYEAWFKDTTATRGFDPPPIIIGDEHSNPCLLMPQDARDNAENS